jgi:CRISPR/Cas system-associated exonuclease Cas4 (RecB family)
LIDNTKKSCESKEVSSFLGVVDTYRRWKHYSERFDRKYHYYHPSELGKCLRAQQYKHYVEKGYIKTSFQGFDSKCLRLFDKGHNMHRRWADYFEDIGVLKGRWKCKNPLCLLFNDSRNGKVEILENKKQEVFEKGDTRIFGEKEQRGVFKPERCVCGCNEFIYQETKVFSEEFLIKGQADLILDFSNFNIEKFNDVNVSFNKKFLPKKGDDVVVDMKTIGQSSWEYQLKKKGPHQSNLIQLTIYVHLLDCSYGLLVYENKNDSKIKCYKVQKNPAWWDILKWQMKKMQDLSLKKRLPPPRPEKKSDYECKSCDFSKLCHKSDAWKDPELAKRRKDFYKGL